MMKVNFFIIGAPKSGTTSLKEYLSMHSEIVTHKSVECAFFHDSLEYLKGERFLLKKYFFAHSHFLNNQLGLIKQASAFFYSNTIRRALEYNSEMQFILLLRNPIDRYISSYFMEVERSAYSKSIEESIEIAFNNTNSWEYKGLNLYGKYDLIINELLEVISPKKLHIVLFEDIKNKPEATLINLQNKLNLKIEPKVIESAKLKVNNSYKVSKSRWLTNVYNKLRHNDRLKSIKETVPASFVYKFNQFYHRINQKEGVPKPNVSNEVYGTLIEYYKESIIQFEKQNNIKTNWLNNK